MISKDIAKHLRRHPKILSTQNKGMKCSSDSNQKVRNEEILWLLHIKSFRSLLLPDSRLTQAIKFFSQVSATEVRELLSPIFFTVRMCWK